MTDEHTTGAWTSGDAYERYVGRWSRRVAPPFLSWLDVPPGRRWLDVGCGTGVLSEAIANRCAPASLDAVEPAAGFLAAARVHLGNRAVTHLASAEKLPLADASVDVVVSGLVLNFVTDAVASLAEMARVTARGGMIAAYVWDYGERMDLMRYFWDAAVELDPAVAAVTESSQFASCAPEPLAELFRGAGLQHVTVTALDIPTVFTSFDDYWNPFMGGTGPAPAYAVSLGESARDELRRMLRERLPIEADGTISLVARAWAVRGRVP